MLRVANVLVGKLDLAQLHQIELYDGELDRLRLLPGDALVVEGNGSLSQVGRAAMWRGAVADCVHQNHVLRARPRIDPSYLASWLLSPAARSEIERVASSTSGLNVLSGRKLRQLPIPVPPLRDQERIAAALEEQLSRLEAARTAAESANRRLRSLRASLIERLTAGEWESHPLGEVFLALRNGCFVSRPKVSPPGIAILRISAVRPLVLDASDARYAPSSLARAEEFRVEEGDVLFTRYSGNPDFVGACAVVTADGAGMLHPDKLIRGIPDRNVILGQWIALVSASGSGRREIEQRLKTTAGQVGISGSQLKTVPIPVPPLRVQTERVAKWSEGLQAIARMETEVLLACRRAGSLRRSILAAAFAGKLVPQDPDDEPASALLARIGAERRAAPPVRRARRGARGSVA